MITVLLPATLRPHANGAEALTITAPVATLAELLAALARKAPRVARQLDDSVFTFTVNDETLRPGESAHPLNDGDRVAILPAIHRS